jgi:D-threo-aldose 1-dehydrogenase
MNNDTHFPLRTYGLTGLAITSICIGCAPLGDMPETFKYSVPEDLALATVRAALAGPFNFLDTAASYGDGESERRIGLVLRELGGVPAGVVLGTKADRDPHSGDFSGDQMKRSVERSLRLLGLERLPLVYIHDPENTTFAAAMAKDGPVEVLLGLKRQGVIEHVGVAGGPIDLMIQFVETGVFEAVITHNRYTLIERSAEPLLAVAAQRGLGVSNAAPYGSGILAKGPDNYPRYMYGPASPQQIERVRRMDGVCRHYGVTLGAAALQFSLRDPRVHTTIVGMSKPQRLAETEALAAVPIPDELWSAIEAVK